MFVVLWFILDRANTIVPLRNFVQRMLSTRQSCTKHLFNPSVIEYDLCSIFYPQLPRHETRDSLKKNISYRTTRSEQLFPKQIVSRHFRSSTWTLSYPIFATKSPPVCRQRYTTQRASHNFRWLFLTRRAQSGDNAFLLPRAIRLRKHGHDKTPLVRFSFDGNGLQTPNTSSLGTRDRKFRTRISVRSRVTFASMRITGASI